MLKHIFIIVMFSLNIPYSIKLLQDDYAYITVYIYTYLIICICIYIYTSKSADHYLWPLPLRCLRCHRCHRCHLGSRHRAGSAPRWTHRRRWWPKPMRAMRPDPPVSSDLTCYEIYIYIYNIIYLLLYKRVVYDIALPTVLWFSVFVCGGPI